jgi:hypothetical protein
LKLILFPILALLLSSLICSAQDASYTLAGKEVFVPKLGSTQIYIMLEEVYFKRARSVVYPRTKRAALWAD